jgi:5-methylcytosine-specific restriction enzyme A
MMKGAPVFRPAFAARSKVERSRAHDVARRKVRPSRRWYSLKAWQVRRRDQLASEPLCRFHLARGETVAATVADHIEPHHDDWDKFIRGALQSLCKRCHDSEKQKAERLEQRLNALR